MMLTQETPSPLKPPPPHQLGKAVLDAAKARSRWLAASL
jgi:hypothetical protein